MARSSNAVLEAIASRRSIRVFEETPLAAEDVETILRAGTQAPSSANRQPWRFLLVYDRQTKRHIAQAMDDVLDGCETTTLHKFTPREVSSVRHSARAIKQAPLVVLVYHFSDLKSPNDYDFYYSDAQSIGACIQNMTLAAHSLGISSLWLCDVLYAEDRINKQVDVLDRKLTAALVLGYKDEGVPHYVASRRALDDTIIGVV